jgi:pimeloyl-ACP methyl ester carboxylesterase
VRERWRSLNHLARFRAELYSHRCFPHPEGYARACEALASALDAAYERVTTPALLLASEEDKTSPKANIDFLASELPRAKVCTLKNVAHWHVLEDVDVTADALKAFTEE